MYLPIRAHPSNGTLKPPSTNALRNEKYCERKIHGSQINSAPYKKKEEPNTYTTNSDKQNNEWFKKEHTET